MSTRTEIIKEIEAQQNKLAALKRPLLEAAYSESNAQRRLARIGISASASSIPSAAEVDVALNKAGITNTVERIKYKRDLERLAMGI